MTGVSGCFGGSQPAVAIDSVEEVSAAVDDIIDSSAESDNSQTAFLLAQHYASMERRVRMLTWTVVALAAVVLLKEL